MRSKHIKYKQKFTKSLDKLSDDIISSDKYITNLSSKHLTHTQKNILSKGLTFVPTTRLNRTRLAESIDKFERSNRIKYYFRNEPPHEPHPFRQKSTW